MKLFLCRPNTTLPFSHIIKQAVSTAAYYYYFIVALRWKGKAGGVGDWKTNRLSFLIHEATTHYGLIDISNMKNPITGTK